MTTMHEWYSQAGQDLWVWEMLNEQRDGFFVEVGAYDGVQTSNTYALEQFGWSGVCIEANPTLLDRLAANRTCEIVWGAVTSYTGTVEFAGDRIVGSGGFEVPCTTLTAMLDAVQAPHDIDYLSIDIEGGEFDALRVFDFERYSVKLMTVEHNLYCEGPGYKDALHTLLSAQGFVRIVEDAPCLDPNPLYFMQPYEDWYASAEWLLHARPNTAARSS